MSDDVHVEAIDDSWMEGDAAIRLTGSRRALLATMGTLHVGSRFLMDRQMETERAMGAIGHGAWEALLDAGWDHETLMAEADLGRSYDVEERPDLVDADVQALAGPIVLKFGPLRADQLRRRGVLATVRYGDEKGITRGDRIRAVEAGIDGSVIGHFRVIATVETFVGRVLDALDALGAKYDHDDPAKLAEVLDRLYDDPIDTGTEVKGIVLEPIEVQS